MCVNLSLPNGHRCAIHMKGTRAVIKTTALEAGVTDKECKAAFKALRKEGKNQPDPTAEEVRAWTQMQRSRLKWNKALSKYDTTIAERQLKAAENENPDGATFHAWRNTLSVVMSRAKPKIFALGLAGSLTMGVGACSPDTVNRTPEVPAAPTTTISAPYSLDTSKHEELGVSVDTTETRTTGAGLEYHPLTISEDAEALQLENIDTTDKKAKEALKKYGEEDVQEAMIFFSQKMVRDYLDAEATYDPSPEAELAQYEAMKDGFTTRLKNDIKTNTKPMHQWLIRDMLLPERKTTLIQGEDGTNTSILHVQAGNLHLGSEGQLGFTVQTINQYSLTQGAFDADAEAGTEASPETQNSFEILAERTFYLKKTDTGEWLVDGIWAYDQGVKGERWVKADLDAGKNSEPEILFDRYEDGTISDFGHSIETPSK